MYCPAKMVDDGVIAPVYLWEVITATLDSASNRDIGLLVNAREVQFIEHWLDLYRDIVANGMLFLLVSI